MAQLKDLIVTGASHFIGNIYGTLKGNADTATKATQDSAGQQINTTYIKGLSVSGKDIIYTKGDNSTDTITTQDTTYGVATSSTLGLIKSGTDITVDSSGNVSINDNSHNHTISNIDNLQNTLDAKVPTNRTIAGVDLADDVTKNELNLALNNAIVITNNDVTVTTDNTKGTAPYNTSYGYTNITVNILDKNNLREDLLLLFICTGNLKVASAHRNVRIRFSESGQWIPLYYTTSIASGSSYMATNQSRFIYYSTKMISSGAFHILTDNNTTYSPASLGSGYGTCSTAAATTAKVATLSSYSLVTGGIVAIKFDYDVPANSTLNINSKGAKSIYYRGAAIPAGIIHAGDIAYFVYSSQYHLLGVNRNGEYAELNKGNVFNGEQKMLNATYAPNMNDIAVGIGCSLKNSRALDNQLIAAEIYAPLNTVNDDTINMQSVANEISFYKMNGANNGQFSGKTLLGKINEDGIYEGSTKLFKKYVSTVANQGLNDTEKTNARNNIGAATAPFKPAGKSYLTFSSPNSFTLAVGDATKHWDGTLEYFNSDKTWTAWDGTTLSSVDNDGEYALYLRGTGNTVITGNSYEYRWVLTGLDISCIGNIENLLDYVTIISGNHPTMATYCYSYMFYGCTSLTRVPALPATTLKDSCYNYMFYGCTSITQAPALPATTLASYCYQSMFNGCRNLTHAPALPATVLANYCYASMFYGCKSLTQAPSLPATTLATSCYNSMFYSCTALTQAPALPATTLANTCYFSMFNNCTSLTKVPTLPAMALATGCYRTMFNGCIGLKFSSTYTSEYTQEYRIPSFGTGITATDALTNMFKDTGGTFTGTPSIDTTYYLSSDNMVVHDTEVATLNGYIKSNAGLKPSVIAITLVSSGWDSSLMTQTVSVTGVTGSEESQLITPIPLLASYIAYYDAGILCTNQAVNSLTFTASTIPTEDLDVYIVIQELGTLVDIRTSPA